MRSRTHGPESRPRALASQRWLIPDSTWPLRSHSGRGPNSELTTPSGERRTSMQDLRYAARVLCRAPGFTALAAVVLALGVGANSAIFSVVDAALLRPLPFHQPDQLVMLWEQAPGHAHNRTSPLNFLDWHDQNTVFAATAAVAGGSRTLQTANGAERITGQAVTQEFFSLLRIPLLVGPRLHQRRCARACRCCRDQRAPVAHAFRRRPGDRRQDHPVGRQAGHRHRRGAGQLPDSLRERPVDAVYAATQSGAAAHALSASARPPEARCNHRAVASGDGRDRRAHRGDLTRHQQGLGCHHRPVARVAGRPGIAHHRPGAFRTGTVHPLDGVRQRRQPDAGARRGADAGNGGTSVARRGRRAAGKAIAHRKHSCSPRSAAPADWAWRGF